MICLRRIPAAIVGAVLLAATAFAQPPDPPPPTAPPESRTSGAEAELVQVTAPVVLGDETLFRVRGSSAYPAEDRARRISERVLEVARDASILPESLKAVPAEEVVNVVAGDRVLMVVTSADAKLEGIDRELLGKVCVDRIQRGLRAYREARDPATLLRGARRALAATLAIGLAVAALAWAFRRLEARLNRRYGERIQAVQYQSFVILRAQHIREVARTLLGLLRGVSVAVLAYLWLQLVLASFPVTQPMAGQLFALVLAPVSRLGSGLLAKLPDLLFLLVLYFITRWLIGLARLFFDAVAERRVALSGFEPEWALPTYRVVRLAIVAFALVVAYPYVPGSRSAAFQGISLFLGVMLSIGSSSFISNIIAGYSMIYRRAFRVGDRIGVDGHLGDVTEIRLLVTHLRSVKNEEIVIPNSTLLGSNVINYTALSRTQGLILHTTVGIGYGTPWRQVEAMLLMAAERTPGLGRTPAPYVLQKSLGDFCVVYELNVPCDDASQMGLLYTRLHRSILDVFNEYGVQIMTPAYEGDPEKPKIVQKEQWWTAPAREDSPGPDQATEPPPRPSVSR